MTSLTIGWITATVLFVAGTAVGAVAGFGFAFYRLLKVLAEMEHRLAALLVAPAPAPVRPLFPPPMPFRPAFAPAPVPPPEQAPQVARTPARPATVPPPSNKPSREPNPQPHRKHPGAHREEHHSPTQANPVIKPAEEEAS